MPTRPYPTKYAANPARSPSASRKKRSGVGTAVAQIKKIDYSHDDVTHIVMTHLHIDHAGGLRDFPQAQIHVHAREHQAALHPNGFMERFYVSAHWAHDPLWVIHDQANTLVNLATWIRQI